MSLTIGATGADTSAMSAAQPPTHAAIPGSTPGLAATKWAFAYAETSLPLPVRALTWAAPIGVLAWLLPYPPGVRVTIVAVCAALLLAYSLLLSRAVRRTGALIPALTELEDFPALGDREVLALAMGRLVVSGPRRPDQDAPAAALANTVRLVMTEADDRSCGQGHSPGCTHRRTTSWWNAWLERHSRPVPSSLTFKQRDRLGQSTSVERQGESLRGSPGDRPSRR